MAILNIGSVNVDLVYRVPHIVAPGETITAIDRRVFAGGKGANQTMALARAGARVFHGGRVGEDGRWILDKLAAAGADTSLVEIDDGPTGHAIIQVADDGENSIVIDGGANRRITPEQVERTLARFGDGDWIVLQNEVNDVGDIIRAASRRELRICFSPAPFGAEVASMPLELVDLLLVNRTEGRSLAGVAGESEAMVSLQRRTGRAVAMTLGGDGVCYRDASGERRVPAQRVTPVDTTAAGDTFTGYLVAGLAEGMAVEDALQRATRAAAICVTRPGAMDSIPTRQDIGE
jgi:ribokinase